MASVPRLPSRSLLGISGGGKPPTLASDFESRVVAVLHMLRSGDVVSYGEVAADAGYPRRARAVGNILAKRDGLPWWRVVTADGRLVPGAERRQAALLRAEGRIVRGGRVVLSERPSVGRRRA